MAAINDTTIYYGFHSAMQHNGNGVLGVYLMNEGLDVLGSYYHECEHPLASNLVFPAPDGGCVIAADSSQLFSSRNIMRMVRLRREDFIMIPLSVDESGVTYMETTAYPNPTCEVLNIPIPEASADDMKIRITDIHGRVWLNCKFEGTGQLLTADVSRLKPGVYIYSLYNSLNTIMEGRSVKQ